MAKPELGTKRTCPETDRNFYDLDKDPIVSPYTGKEYPISFFEGEEDVKPAKAEEVKASKEPETSSEEETPDDGPEIISLEDADEGADGDEEVDEDDVESIPELPDDVELDDDENEDDDSNTFIDDEDEDTDLSDVIGGVDPAVKEDT